MSVRGKVRMLQTFGEDISAGLFMAFVIFLVLLGLLVLALALVILL